MEQFNSLSDVDAFNRKEAVAALREIADRVEAVAVNVEMQPIEVVRGIVEVASEDGYTRRFEPHDVVDVTLRFRLIRP